MTRILYLATLAVVVACSPSTRSDVPNTNNNSSSLTVEQYWDAMFTAYCEAQVRCDSTLEQAACVKAIKALASGNGFNEVGTQIAAVKANKVAYDGTSAKKCITLIDTALDAMSCSDLRASQGPPSTESDECKAVFTGSYENGAACVADIECKAGSLCEAAPTPESSSSTGPSCEGTCVAGGTKCHTNSHCTGGKVCENQTCVTVVPAGNENQACGTNRSCAAGLFCDYVPSGGYRCKQPAMAGQECSGYSGSCVAGTSCVYHNDDSGMSTCMAPRTKGQSCQYDGECSGLFSNYLICNDTSHTCQEPPATGHCERGYYCAGTAYCDTTEEIPSCYARKALGATCNPSLYGTDCPSGAVHCEVTGGASTGVCTADAACMP